MIVADVDRNVGGMTLHSWAGVGLGVEKASDLARAVSRFPAAKQRWERSSALIIDESKYNVGISVNVSLYD